MSSISNTQKSGAQKKAQISRPAKPRHGTLKISVSPKSSFRSVALGISFPAGTSLMSNGNTNGPLRIIRVTPRDQTVAWLKRWAGNSAIGFSFLVTVVIAVLALVSAVLVFTAAGRLLVWWAHTADK